MFITSHTTDYEDFLIFLRVSSFLIQHLQWTKTQKYLNMYDSMNATSKLNNIV